MKALVLGDGFIGSAMARLLEEKCHKVVTLSRKSGFDLTHSGSARAAFSAVNPDAIFNCAGHVGSMAYVMKNAGTVAHDNLIMAANLYKAAQEACPHAHIVNPLSNCSYPGNSDVQRESRWWDGEPHYTVLSVATAKRATYTLARSYRLQYGLRTTNFLVPNAFGPGDSLDPNKTHALSGLIVRMIKAKRAKEPKFEVWGSGKPIREWGYIQDIVEILSRAVTLAEDNVDPINIAQNKGYSIKESAEIIQKHVGYDGDLWFNKDHHDGDPQKVLDDAKFKIIFPEFTFTDHVEAIRRTVRYYEGALT